MSDPTYLDTSAVLRWALHNGGSPSPRDAAGHTMLERLLASDAPVVLSPVTIIEVTTNLNRKVRATNDWFATFDAATAERTIAELMNLLRPGGRIVPRNLGPRAFETAMMWVAEAVRIGGARLLAWDAVHLYEAVRWSRELGAGRIVQVATSDSDFDDFIGIMPELAQHVAIFDVCAP